MRDWSGPGGDDVAALASGLAVRTLRDVLRCPDPADVVVQVNG